ncbi:hypothetical protein TrVE_jg9317 [Triparma verrucosa]|uniref:Uncharacterized protein n=1 Tax=Triparma verrucosa TaxID=1606542 RepID=A0A9W7CLN4_9STRA|nr:hypothetical protein TrVE_jg9317 [Triparma verrucosa]
MLVFPSATEISVAASRQASGLVNSVLRRTVLIPSIEAFCASLSAFTDEVILPNFISSSTGSFEGGFIGTMMQLRDMLVYNHKALQLPEEGITERANLIIQTACDLRNSVVNDGGALSQTVMSSIYAYDETKMTMAMVLSPPNLSSPAPVALIGTPGAAPVAPPAAATPPSFSNPIVDQNFVERHHNPYSASDSFRRVAPLEAMGIAASLVNTLRGGAKAPDAVFTNNTHLSPQPQAPPNPHSVNSVSPDLSPASYSTSGSVSSSDGSPYPTSSNNYNHNLTSPQALTSFEPKRTVPSTDTNTVARKRQPSAKIRRKLNDSRVSLEARSSRKTPQRWESWEDNMLLTLRNANPDWTWQQLAMGLQANGFNRGPKQTRERFINHLAEGNNVKGPWSEQEDRQLISAWHEYGNRWTKIATFIAGRSEISVKNRFKTIENILSKRRLPINIENVLATKAAPIKYRRKTDSGADSDSDDEFVANRHLYITTLPKEVPPPPPAPSQPEGLFAAGAPPEAISSVGGAQELATYSGTPQSPAAPPTPPPQPTQPTQPV